MGVLEKVMKMQKKGVSDSEIIKKLREQGVSPQEITDALGQSKVKNAVSEEAHQAYENQATENMQQSIMQPQDLEQAPPQHEQAPQQEQYYAETPQAYTGEEYYPQQSALDTETITEIAEQIVSEKFSEFNKKTGDLSSFKENTLEKLKDLDERLKRIEDSINRLQQAVIGKIGEFGENTETIHKDLDNLHSTVSKLMNPLIDNYKELKKIAKSKNN
jgi:hypothetical protein